MTQQTFPFAQRWRARRDRYRPAGEIIQTRNYDVTPLPDDRTAKSFILAHHYSATYPAARYRFGLWRGTELVGVAVFSHPCNDAVLTGIFPVPAIECAELGRFVLLDSVPGNGETWFLGRCFEVLKRAGLVGIVSYSDPMPRTSSAGRVVFGGHVGTIYQAHNGIYLGRSRARTLRMLPDGSVLSDRAIQKLRARERGWEYAAERLVSFGADRPGLCLKKWATEWIKRLTRPAHHPGNHKYAWPLSRAISRCLPVSLPYPKMIRFFAA